MAKILIVDDQPCVRHFLAEQLAGLPEHLVTSAGSAELAAARLKASLPDLVLLDLYLDGADGFELFNDMKRQYPQLPVIIFTAYDSFRDDPRLFGADGYVLKSVDPAKLLGKIAEVLGQRRQVHQGATAGKPYFHWLKAMDGI